MLWEKGIELSALYYSSDYMLKSIDINKHIPVATVGQETRGDQLVNQEKLLEEGIKGKKVGQIHYFLRGTDGVSLQAQETARFLQSVRAITFDLAADVADKPLPELDYHSDRVVSLRNRMFDPSVDALTDEAKNNEEKFLLQEIYEGAESIYTAFLEFIESNDLDIVHVRNLLSMPFLHIEAAVALERVIRDKPNIRFVLHHHDFYWEGPESVKYVTHYLNIQHLADSLTAPNHPNTKHICINTIAQQELLERKGVTASYIPDGFDFDKQVVLMTAEQESEFKNRYGIKENDLVLALTTRVRTNKGFQTAIEIAKTLGAQKNQLVDQQDGVGKQRKKFGVENEIIVLVIQSADFDESYYAQIENYAKEQGVRLLYVGDSVVSDDRFTEQDAKDGKYSFYTITQSAIIDAVLYVATHEGFGNQAIEAAWAKLLLVMFGYPVAIVDIFHHIDGIIKVGSMDDTSQWGDTELPIVNKDVVELAVDELISVLLNHETEKQMVESAYEAFRSLCHIRTIGLKYLEIYLEN